MLRECMLHQHSIRTMAHKNKHAHIVGHRASHIHTYKQTYIHTHTHAHTHEQHATHAQTYTVLSRYSTFGPDVVCVCAQSGN
jgi:hypothetical protein